MVPPRARRGRDTRGGLIGGVALTVVVRVLRIGASFGASVLTARVLGPAGRGDYFFVVALSALVVQVAHLGLGSSNSYLVAKRPETLGPLVTNSVWVAAIASGGSSILIVAAIGAGGWFSVATGQLLFAVPLSVVTLFYLLGSNLLVGAGRIVLFNIIESIANLLVLAAILFAVLAFPTVAAALSASVVGWTIASGLLL